MAIASLLFSQPETYEFYYFDSSSSVDMCPRHQPGRVMEITEIRG